jgi:hypothetical protein
VTKCQDLVTQRHLSLAYVGGGGAFLALLDGKFDAIAFLQCTEPWLLDGGMMHKHIFSIFTGYESVALLIVEPLDGSGLCFTHFALNLPMYYMILCAAHPGRKIKNRPDVSSLDGLLSFSGTELAASN